MALLIALLLAVVMPDQANASDLEGACTLVVPVAGYEESDDMVNTLWQWCLESPACREAYHQSRAAPNRTVFRHLLPPDVGLSSTSREDVYGEMRTELCTGTVENVNRAMWMQRIIAYRRTLAPLCDVNHELRFDNVTLRSECICRADRVCTDAIYDLVPFYVALGLVAAAGIAAAAGALYKDIMIVRALPAVTGDRASDTSALISALT